MSWKKSEGGKIDSAIDRDGDAAKSRTAIFMSHHNSMLYKLFVIQWNRFYGCLYSNRITFRIAGTNEPQKNENVTIQAINSHFKSHATAVPNPNESSSS